MELTFHSIHSKGDHREEFVVFEAQADCDLDLFAVFDSTYLPNGMISNQLRHVHWFTHREVLKGDLVQLFTRRGKDESVPRKEGSTLHKVHWGLREAVWNDGGDAVVLVKTSAWNTHVVAPQA